jgi:lactoylglutathione lyase
MGPSEAPQGSALETVIIFTERMEELARFYAEGLGIGPYEASPGHLGCQVGAVYFGFDQVERAPAGAGGGVTIWFTVDDIQSTFERLVALGAEVRYGPTRKPWGALLAALHDPDGNILGLSGRGEA